MPEGKKTGMEPEREESGREERLRAPERDLQVRGNEAAGMGPEREESCREEKLKTSEGEGPTAVSQGYLMRPVAYMRCDLPQKFGIPRQSGIVPSLQGRIEFTEDFRDPNALKGIEGFDYIWLLWAFSGTAGGGWSPTVRPPRLGGDARMGVFATRSPFRPNPIGLSCVKLEGVEDVPGKGKALLVSGADLMDGTPILDIKPYLAFTDSHADAAGGFTEEKEMKELKVCFPEEYLSMLPEEKRGAAEGILKTDPRPRYQDDPDRIYGLLFAGCNIRFRVAGEELTVCGVETGPDDGRN